MEHAELRQLVFGFLDLRQLVTRAWLVCRGWSGTRAAWDTVTEPAELALAVRPKTLDLRSARNLDLLTALPQLRSLQQVSFAWRQHFYHVTDAHLTFLSTNLHTLDLSYATLPLKRILAICSDCDSLTALSLPIGEHAEAFVVQAVSIPGFVLRLQKLVMRHVSQRAFALLANFQALIILNVTSVWREEDEEDALTRLDDLASLSGLEELQLHCRNCESFAPSRSLRRLDITVSTLSSACWREICVTRTLRSLDFVHTQWDAGVLIDWSWLPRLRDLTSLELGGGNWPRETFQAVRALPVLKDLKICTWRGDGVWLAELREHRSLERVDLASSNAGPEQAAFLLSLPRLRWTRLGGRVLREHALVSELRERGVAVEW